MNNIQNTDAVSSSELKDLITTATSGTKAEASIHRIKEIDRSEKSLYQQLEKIVNDINTMNNQLTLIKGKPEEESNEMIIRQNIKNLENVQSQLVLQIKQLSADRIQLYKDLGNKYVDLQTVVNESKDDLIAQTTVAGVMDKELSNIEKEMNNLVDEKHRKMKLIEIDTYYGKRYKSYTELMKMIAYTCIPILIVVIVFKLNFITRQVRSLLLLLIMIVGGYIVSMQAIDIWYRDNMNWDEYRFIDKNSNNGGQTVWQYDKAQWDKFKKDHNLSDATSAVTDMLGVECYDEGCCNHPDGKVRWDKKKKECVMNTHPLDNQHTNGVNNQDMDAKKSVVSAFTLLDSAPVCNKKNHSLSATVNDVGSIVDLDNLAQNLCQDTQASITPFDGF